MSNFNPEEHTRNANSKKDQHTKKLQRLSSQSDEEIDDRFEEVHNEVFACTDCLKCANCCKTKGPNFNKKDINRIARHLGMTPTEFDQKYLELNENEDYVLKSTPCVFLKHDNYCSIYEVRPQACASYPHTNTRKVSHMFDYFIEHSKTCPAILEIVEKV